MLRGSFRPWGQLPWVLNKLSTKSWSLLGCLATEERCLSVWEVMRLGGWTRRAQFIEILDSPSRFTKRASELRAEYREQLVSSGINLSQINQHSLFDLTENIVNRIDDFLGLASESVVFDISCYPKRFFFPFLRRLIENPRISDLIVTYSIPQKYFDGVLAEDHKAMSHLPLFGPEEFPEPPTSLAIVGIGFVPLGIAELINDDRNDVEYQLLFPFPPGPPFYYRNWKFLSELQDRLPVHSDPIRVEAYDVSDTFDHLLKLTNRGSTPAVFAPYGPKPMSLAMCLFASQTKSQVLYTQPTIYHPEYTSGVRRVNDQAVIYAYCIKLAGKNLYSIGLPHERTRSDGGASVVQASAEGMVGAI